MYVAIGPQRRHLHEVDVRGITGLADGRARGRAAGRPVPPSQVNSTAFAGRARAVARTQAAWPAHKPGPVCEDQEVCASHGWWSPPPDRPRRR